MLPALPSAQSMTPAALHEYGARLVEWCEQVDDIHEIRNAAAKWSALTEYVKRTSREGVADAEAALRRIEERVGLLIREKRAAGELASVHDNQHMVITAVTTSLADLGIPGRQAAEFVLMAEHSDIVEAVIAASTDAEPPSRRKVIGAIRQTLADQEAEQGHAEDQAWAANLRAISGIDAADDKRRAEARYAIRGFAAAAAKLTSIGYDNIVDALEAALPHVRDDLSGRLRTAITTTQQLVDHITAGTKGQP